MCITPALFSASLVHRAILSPLVRMLTTAPHTSPLYSSKLSPSRHINWAGKRSGERPSLDTGSTPPALRPPPLPKAHTASLSLPPLTVSSHRRSSSMWRCCLARLSSQRPPRLFLLSSHMGWMPSCGEGQINCLPLFKGKWTPSSLCTEPSLLYTQGPIRQASLTYLPPLPIRHHLQPLSLPHKPLPRP